MAQTGRPASDITVGSWGASPLWSKVNDESDAVFISTTAAATTGEVKLGSLSAPVGEGHVVTLRARATGSGGAERLNTWGLYQGSTAISTLNSAITRSTFNDYTITLSPGEIAAITDYTDLRVRFTAAQNAGETLAISNIRFVIPDAPPPVDNLTASGIDTGAPVFDQPTLAEESGETEHNLTASNIETDGVVNGSPAIGQVHALRILNT